MQTTVAVLPLRHRDCKHVTLSLRVQGHCLHNHCGLRALRSVAAPVRPSWSRLAQFPGPGAVSCGRAMVMLFGCAEPLQNGALYKHSITSSAYLGPVSLSGENRWRTQSLMTVSAIAAAADGGHDGADKNGPDDVALSMVILGLLSTLEIAMQQSVRLQVPRAARRSASASCATCVCCCLGTPVDIGVLERLGDERRGVQQTWCQSAAQQRR